MTKVFIYLSEINGEGFNRQEQTCRAFAVGKGWHVARTFREGGDHKQLNEAMELAGEINTIIVERSDRISNDQVVTELFLRECRRRGIQVFAADSRQDIVNSEGSPTQVLIRRIISSLEQWEKNITSRRLQAGRRATAERTGKPCGAPLPNPYGDRGGVAQKNEERKVLNTIVGLKRDGFSCKAIAKHLRDSRIKTPNPLLRPNVPWQWSGKTVERLVNKWMHREEMK